MESLYNSLLKNQNPKQADDGDASADEVFHSTPSAAAPTPTKNPTVDVSPIAVTSSATDKASAAALDKNAAASASAPLSRPAPLKQQQTPANTAGADNNAKRDQGGASPDPWSMPYFDNPFRLFPEVSKGKLRSKLDRLNQYYKESSDDFREEPNDTDLRLMNLLTIEINKLEKLKLNEGSDSGCIADGPQSTDKLTSDLRVTEHNKTITYSVMGYSTQHTQMSVADITSGAFSQAASAMMHLDHVQRTSRNVIDAHNYSVLGFLSAYAEAVKRYGHDAYALNNTPVANLTSINSGPILAAMNCITNRVGQDLLNASELNTMVPAMMLVKQDRARKEERRKEEEGREGKEE